MKKSLKTNFGTSLLTGATKGKDIKIDLTELSDNSSVILTLGLLGTGKTTAIKNKIRQIREYEKTTGKKKNSVIVVTDKLFEYKDMYNDIDILGSTDGFLADHTFKNEDISQKIAWFTDFLLRPGYVNSESMFIDFATRIEGEIDRNCERNKSGDNYRTWLFLDKTMYKYIDKVADLVVMSRTHGCIVNIATVDINTLYCESYCDKKEDCERSLGRILENASIIEIFRTTGFCSSKNDIRMLYKVYKTDELGKGEKVLIINGHAIKLKEKRES